MRITGRPLPRDADLARVPSLRLQQGVIGFCFSRDLLTTGTAFLPPCADSTKRPPRIISPYPPYLNARFQTERCFKLRSGGAYFFHLNARLHGARLVFLLGIRQFRFRHFPEVIRQRRRL